MDRKGQIFSLDFLISLVLVILSLGLMLNFIELHEYTLREQELHNELRAVGETAADLLVSNPAITCQVFDESENPLNYSLTNCIPRTSSGYVINNGILAIPADYDFCIEGIIGDAADFLHENQYDECVQGSMPRPDIGNIYSATRTIVVFKGTDTKVKKSYLEAFMDGCMDTGDCPENSQLNSFPVLLKVWRAP